jgi:hypothetical protein
MKRFQNVISFWRGFGFGGDGYKNIHAKEKE